MLHCNLVRVTVRLPQHSTQCVNLFLFTCKIYYCRGIIKLADSLHKSKHHQNAAGEHCSQLVPSVFIQHGAAAKLSTHCISWASHFASAFCDRERLSACESFWNLQCSSSDPLPAASSPLHLRPPTVGGRHSLWRGAVEESLVWGWSDAGGSQGEAVLGEEDCTYRRVWLAGGEAGPGVMEVVDQGCLQQEVEEEEAEGLEEEESPRVAGVVHPALSWRWFLEGSGFGCCCLGQPGH